MSIRHEIVIPDSSEHSPQVLVHRTLEIPRDDTLGVPLAITDRKFPRIPLEAVINGTEVRAGFADEIPLSFFARRGEGYEATQAVEGLSFAVNEQGLWVASVDFSQPPSERDQRLFDRGLGLIAYYAALRAQ